MVKEKINQEQEVESFVSWSKPMKKTKEEEKKDLVSTLLDTLGNFRSKLPPRSVVYTNAITSIICSLNTYRSFENDNIGGVWKGYDYLCMAYTQFSQLEYFTRPKSETRDSVIRKDLNKFLKDIDDTLFHPLLSFYNDYSVKH